MGLWYCEKHKNLDKDPNGMMTLYEGKECCVEGCKNTLNLLNKKNFKTIKIRK